MAVDRHTPTTTSDPGGILGSTFATAIDEEVAALWGYVGGILTNVVGTNAITATCVVTILAYTNGLKVTLKPAANNTTNATINIDGVGVVNILDQNGNPLAANMLVGGQRQVLEYDSILGAFALSGASGNAGGNIKSATSVFANQQTAGTAGGAATSGSYQIYPLNTSVVNEMSGEGVALSSNVFNLNPGTYDIYASAPFNNTGLSRLRLFNVTDSAVVTTLAGETIRSTAVNDVKIATLRGRFTITAAKNFRLEYRCAASEATDGLGQAAVFGAETERYGVIMIERPAAGGLNFGSIASHNLTISTVTPSGGVDGDIWFQVAP